MPGRGSEPGGLRLSLNRIDWLPKGLWAKGEVGETMEASAGTTFVVRNGLVVVACGLGDVVSVGTVTGRISPCTINKHRKLQTYKLAIPVRRTS